ncbi:MAG: dihydropteroate synthase [Sulfurimonas sp.]|nr:dihydropteroate synthase [Sulfurimonas sp.]MBU3938620.1 dihydropteroate synthase [bacterium]MBU4024687.1 dihydropteroate synthase [bacterium]MBU4059544.1 dihydropteroate synthase [bacterium]MBU4110976.1 dihydropteroate synthase [bacterium]
MLTEKLSLTSDAKKLLKELGVDGGGVNILASKMHSHIISIKDLHVGAANILKQDALSIGADLAVPRGTVIAKTQFVDVILIATQKQLEILAKKELAQPFGLKELAKNLKEIAQAKKPQKTQVMGIINANDDSFYAQSRFSSKEAVNAIVKMIEEGAEIIDIGGVSSRPNAALVSAAEEMQRVQPILDAIKNEKLYERAAFSIDSYTPEVIEYALNSGFHIVNDITGLANDAVCKLCASYNAKAVIMHMQGTPQTMQKEPKYESILSDISIFFEERIQKAESFGVKDIILDVGIGFGKTLEDNLRLIKNLEHFLTLNKPLLVGASRKSLINAVTPADVFQRLAGTLALHLAAYENGASILRVHDVKEHVQALQVKTALDKI